MMPVRWLTSLSRTRCRACKSSCSAVLVATNFIVRRCITSAIASASRKSFFCPLLYAHTYFAGISRASRSSACGSGDERRSGTQASQRAALRSGRLPASSGETATRWQGEGMVAGEPQLSLSRLLEIAQIGRRLILAGRHQVAVAAHEIVLLADEWTVRPLTAAQPDISASRTDRSL